MAKGVFVARHGVGLAAAGLSIRENRGRVPIQRRLQEILSLTRYLDGTLCENLLLRSTLIEYLVEPGLLLLLIVSKLERYFISQTWEFKADTQVSSMRELSSLFIGRIRRHTFTLSPCLKVSDADLFD